QLGGAWSQFNQVQAAQATNTLGIAITEINGNSLAFQDVSPAIRTTDQYAGSNGLPAVSAALASPVGSGHANLTFSYTPDSDGRSFYSVGLMTSDGLVNTGNPGIPMTPKNGLGIDIMR